MTSLSEQILQYASDSPEGTVLFSKGLLHLGNRAAVDQSLSRFGEEWAVDANRAGGLRRSCQELVSATGCPTLTNLWSPFQDSPAKRLSPAAVLRRTVSELPLKYLSGWSI